MNIKQKTIDNFKKLQKDDDFIQYLERESCEKAIQYFYNHSEELKKKKIFFGKKFKKVLAKKEELAEMQAMLDAGKTRYQVKEKFDITWSAVNYYIKIGKLKLKK